jgi:hypothetical protein
MKTRVDYGSHVKIELSLCLINYALCHEDIRGRGAIAPPFLTSSLNGSEWSASRPSRFSPGESDHGTHWIGDCVGTRADLDDVE